MVREALLGNLLQVRAQPPTMRGHLMSEDMQFAWGFASAIIGDAARGQALADDLAKRFPEDTLVQFVYVPMIRAQLWIARYDSRLRPRKSCNPPLRTKWATCLS